MAEVSNEEVAFLMSSPHILYVEGESDERLLRAWAEQCGAQEIIGRVCFRTMGGGGKKNMKERADQHFSALQQIIPEVSRLMLFDYDSSDEAFHPPSNNPSLAEWTRKNIENYLLVPDAWKRAALKHLRCGEDDLLAQLVIQLIDQFFSDENLTLPPGKSWRSVRANIFSVVDGKCILFENADSLFHQLVGCSAPTKLLREEVALSMTVDEIHEDVHDFVHKLYQMVLG